MESIKSTLKAGEAFLIISPENRKYLTGFSSSAGYLFITKDETVFFTDSRYIEAAEKQCRGCERVLEVTDRDAQLCDICKELSLNAVYTEEDNLSLKRFNILREILPCEVKGEKVDDAIFSMRRKKSPEELKIIKYAQRIAEEAFEHILGIIREGISEKEIALETDYYMLSHGADAPSFETIALTGESTSMPHGVPGSRKVQKGDFILMDFGALVSGYHSDMTRTFAFGEPGEEKRKVYETVLLAQKTAIATYFNGVKCSVADAAARDIIKKNGYGNDFGHSTGHGVGIDIHEKPTVSSRSAEILLPGDVVTVEPGIYLPGKFGVRIEDMLYIGENYVENLTATEKELIIL